VIHLVVPLDEPATLCGLGRSWGAPVAWRYPKDLAEVTCAACLLRFEGSADRNGRRRTGPGGAAVSGAVDGGAAVAPPS
jgi:hypothetical protein